MARADQTQITLRLIIDKPVAGVAHSLQDKKNYPIDMQVAGKSDLIFEFPVRVGPGPKFYGEHVRSEGPERRFVYICVGTSAGQAASRWTRRMKIDIHMLPQSLIDKAIKGRTIEARIPGTGADGTPACATVKPLGPWRAT